MKRIYFSLGSFFALPLYLVLHLVFDVPLLAGTIIGFVYVVVYVIAARRTGFLTKLDWAMFGYLLAGSVLALVHESAARFILADHGTTFVFLALFCAAFFPVVLGLEPFTVDYAKRDTPPEVWETPQFKEINRIMTLVWAGLFLAAAAVALNPGPIFSYVIPALMPPVLGIPFNRKFPDWYLKRQGLKAD
jgi:hypothetical protein